MRHCLLLCIFTAAALAADPSPGGKITGRVVEHASGRPVEYAAVVLKNSAGQPVQRAATDAKGEFAIEKVPPGDYRIAYGLIGTDAQDSPAISLDAQHRDA